MLTAWHSRLIAIKKVFSIQFSTLFHFYFDFRILFHLSTSHLRNLYMVFIYFFDGNIYSKQCVCWFGFTVRNNERIKLISNIVFVDTNKKVLFLYFWILFLYFYLNKMNVINIIQWLPNISKTDILSFHVVISFVYLLLLLFPFNSPNLPLKSKPLNDWQCLSVENQLWHFHHSFWANIEDLRWKWNKNSCNPSSSFNGQEFLFFMPLCESLRSNENNNNNAKRIMTKQEDFFQNQSFLQTNKRKKEFCKQKFNQLDCSRMKMTKIYYMRQFDVRKTEPE